MPAPVTLGPRNLFLIGPRACGKTTLGRRLAARLGAEFADADALFVARHGRSIAEVAAEDGWDAFRDLEAAILADACADVPPQGRVLATGGGVVLRPANRTLLATGLTVYLRAEPSTLVARLSREPLVAQRPTLTGLPLAEEVARTLAEREPLYQERARLVVDAGRPLEQAERDILAFLAAAP